MDKKPAEDFFAEDVFENIFKTHFKELHAYAYSLVRDWDSAEEIVQGMFLKLWEKQSAVSINSSVRSYLYKTFKNDILNYLKSKKFPLRYQTFKMLEMEKKPPDTAGKLRLNE